MTKFKLIGAMALSLMIGHRQWRRTRGMTPTVTIWQCKTRCISAMARASAAITPAVAACTETDSIPTMSVRMVARISSTDS